MHTREHTSSMRGRTSYTASVLLWTSALAQITPQTNRGMIIDAGSTGSRLHVYEWEPREFSTLPPPVSYPSQKTHWTGRMEPGISSFAGNPELAGQSLLPLIAFAMDLLQGHKEKWHIYPIYLKATGGMREVPYAQREAIMDNIRLFLSNKDNVPFHFEHDFARVISGEEEAIYSWTAVNFLKKTLIPQLQGTGTVDPNATYGVVDLGGASTQISFFDPSQDISANMFKLQIGAQKHWNLYGHSFLRFGHVSARERFNELLIANASIAVNTSVVPQVVNPCYPVGYQEFYTTESGVTVLLTAPSTDTVPDSVNHEQMLLTDGENNWRRDVFVDDDKPEIDDDRVYDVDDVPQDGPRVGQFDMCKQSLVPLLRKQANSWCESAHGLGQCSFNGVYQPPLPKAQFWGMASYHYAWDFLGLRPSSALVSLRNRATKVCSYDFEELKEYTKSIRNKLGLTHKVKSYRPYYCFLAAYTHTLLVEGHGFRETDVLEVHNTFDGHKLSWALGAMLYEINALPWRYTKECSECSTAPSLLDEVGVASVSLFVGIILAFLVVIILIHRKGIRYSRVSRALVGPSNRQRIDTEATQTLQSASRVTYGTSINI